MVEEVGVAEEERGGGGVGVNVGKEQKVILIPLVQGGEQYGCFLGSDQMMFMWAMFVGCVGTGIGLL